MTGRAVLIPVGAIGGLAPRLGTACAQVVALAQG
jgi:hypothetical protein